MRPSCLLAPWGCINSYHISICLSKISLKPHCQTICFKNLLAQWLYMQCFMNLVYLLIACFIQVKLKQFDYFAYDKSRINDTDAQLLCNPFLHFLHCYSVHFIPILYFFIYLVLIPYQCTFISNSVWDHYSIFFIQEQISCINHPVNHAIIYQVASHWLSNQNIDFTFYFKILIQLYLNYILISILFYQLLHHTLIFIFAWVMTIQNAVYLLCACFCRKY